jgi:hypothetical protein
MTYEQIENEFDETSFKWADLEDGNGRYILESQVKSFLTQSHIRLLQSLKEELPEPIDETNPVHDFTGDPGEWNVARIGFNRCLSTIHQLIDNAIKSIEV